MDYCHSRTSASSAKTRRNRMAPKGVKVIPRLCCSHGAANWRVFLNHILDLANLPLSQVAAKMLGNGRSRSKRGTSGHAGLHAGKHSTYSRNRAGRSVLQDTATVFRVLLPTTISLILSFTSCGNPRDFSLTVQKSRPCVAA